MKKIRDKWGNDSQTGARGLEIGHRTVKSGAVKIGRELWVAVRGSLSAHEGKVIEVAVEDAWSSRYTARDAETLQTIATLGCSGIRQT